MRGLVCRWTAGAVRHAKSADYVRQVDAAVRFIAAEPLLGSRDGLDLCGIDWLIAGGESGPAHVPGGSSGFANCATAAPIRAWPTSSSSGPGTGRSRAGESRTAERGVKCRPRSPL